ncbi:hypothetical protein [Parapedobacter lycopersici]|uniref:hypothetical protein n=1 Tax=Parapedobacter lycopersici TaxID=1864939 RepID=UPI003342CEF4
MIKKIALLGLCILAFAACGNRQTSADATQNSVTEPQAVGGEKDEHGCLPSTGSTWSELRQDCIQVFDVGVRLNPVNSQEGEAVFSAFAVFNDDRSKLELFLPEDGEKPILTRSGDVSYQNGAYRFDTKDSSLYINGSKQFSIAE